MDRYKKIKIVGDFGDNGGLIYQAIKDDKKFYVYEFQQYGEAEAYNFKVLAKIMSSHVLAVYEEFEQNGTKYVVTDYAEKDLLQSQTAQPNRVFPLPVALDYFSKLILALEQLHENKLVYRNVRPELIKLREDNVYLYDFTLSQFCKRKERMFDVVGCQSFLAPEFFSEDGYSFQIDIWAAGVLLFFMLTNDYPFKFKNKTEKASQEEFQAISDGFSFEKRLEVCKNPGFIKSNKMLQDFFTKIFTIDYTQRLTIKQIKNHKLLTGFFPQKIDKDILQAIGQQQSTINSLLMTKFLDLKHNKISAELQREQIILDFIERCSQSLMLDCTDYIPEEIRSKAQFAILKVAMIKINYLVDVCYGKRKLEGDYDEEEFQMIKSSSAFKRVVEALEKKQKILHMLYKSAFMTVKSVPNDPFYQQEIPEDFNTIKISYRLAVASMFDALKPVMSKYKADKSIIRKVSQIMARMVIMHLINRIFEPENIAKNFSLYIKWNQSQEIDNLDAWIHSEKHQLLRQFVKDVTKNYL